MMTVVSAGQQMCGPLAYCCGRCTAGEGHGWACPTHRSCRPWAMSKEPLIGLQTHPLNLQWVHHTCACDVVCMPVHLHMTACVCICVCVYVCLCMSSVFDSATKLAAGSIRIAYSGCPSAFHAPQSGWTHCIINITECCHVRAPWCRQQPGRAVMRSQIKDPLLGS